MSYVASRIGYRNFKDLPTSESWNFIHQGHLRL